MQWMLRHLGNGTLSYLNPLYWLTVAMRCNMASRLALLFAYKNISNGEIVLKSIGSEANAVKVARHAIRAVPAYKKLTSGGLPTDWQNYPITDKKSYIHSNHISELLADNYLDTFSIFRSSGSSGKATYWPQLKSDHRLSSWAVQIYLESCFQIHRKKTLIIIGLSLGSWIGGDHLSSLLKQCSLQVPYPLTIFAPGNRYEEIVEIIREAQTFVDQIILVVCPSAIGHLKLYAESRGMFLPSDKMKYLVLGEAFPEPFRISLESCSGPPNNHPLMFSMYGSADTGALGVESKASIALRQLMLSYPTLRKKVGISGDVPHFFHACAPDAYMETIDNELCVTRWQGVPIIRYNLHDHATLFNWKDLHQMVSGLDVGTPEDKARISIVEKSSPDLPPLIAIYGRADRCLILCGTNISESMLNSAFKCVEMQNLLTGMYQAKILYDEGRQYLSLDVELKQGVAAEANFDKTIYNQLVVELCKVQPEFEEDWKHIYVSWDDEPNKRVLRINYRLWPEMSKMIESGVKYIGIQK